MGGETKPDWFNIPRQSPEYEVLIRGERAVFTYGNIMCYFFAKEYEAFNHIFYLRENNLHTYIFNAQETMDQLHDFGYPMCYEPYPSEEDVEAFIRSETQDLDSSGI